MKKARVMLLAIAVFAAVGGALAFKANHFNPLVHLFTYTTSASPLGGACVQSSAEESYVATTQTATPAFFTTISLAQNLNTTTCETYVFNSAE